jgi:integrase
MLNTTDFLLNIIMENVAFNPSINTIGNLPKMIAKHIGLPNCVLFTGHCFRRTSATWLADSGADIMKIKRHGGWKSNSVAEGYVEDSLENKKKIATDILGDIGEFYYHFPFIIRS